jgi:hypothetical protein
MISRLLLRGEYRRIRSGVDDPGRGEKVWRLLLFEYTTGGGGGGGGGRTPSIIAVAHHLWTWTNCLAPSFEEEQQFFANTR